MERNNSKQIVLSVLAVIVLVIAVVGVSFAMYTFTGTGTRENSISTGALSLEFDGAKEQLLVANNRLPETDAAGLQEAEVLSFSVAAAITGTATINYNLSFTSTPGTYLTNGDIKYYLMDGNGKALAGFGTCSDPSATTEAACTGTWTPAAKTMPANGTTFMTDTFTLTGSHDYKIKAWISSDFDLPTNGVTGSCSVTEHTTEAACEANNGVWTQSNQTIADTFRFTVNVSAAQQ